MDGAKASRPNRHFQDAVEALAEYTVSLFNIIQ